MTSLRLITINLLAGSALLVAQTQQNNGWRRWNDPAPAPQAQAAAPNLQDQQDPSQPVARTDDYGQPQQGQQQLQQRPPAAVPHYGLPTAVAIKPGTFLTVRVDQPLSSDHNQQNDFFSATLVQPVVVDGIVVAQRGQPVTGRVAEAKKAGRVEGTSRLALQLNGLTLVDGTQANVQTQLFQRNGNTSIGSDVGAVATTTGVGAAVGAAADWGRGAAIGAGAGAAAGVIGVLLTRGRPTVVYPETLLTFRVEKEVIVDLTRAPQAFRYVGPDEYDQPVQTTVARRPPPAPRPYYSPYPYYGGPGYYPGYYYPYGYGPSFGVVVRGGGWGWGGRRWR
jgi:hypothetical protein